MIPGTISILLYVIMVVLLITGWWSRVLALLSMHRMPAIVWLTIWFTASWLTLSPHQRVQINLGFGLVLFVACYCWGKTPLHHRPMLFATIVLTGSMCYFIREMVIIDPALLMLPASSLQAGIVLLLAGTSFTGIWPRLALLTGGLSGGYLLSLFRHLHDIPTWHFGDLRFFDMFWSCFMMLLIMESVTRGLMWAGQRLFVRKSDKTNG